MQIINHNLTILASSGLNLDFIPENTFSKLSVAFNCLLLKSGKETRLLLQMLALVAIEKIVQQSLKLCVCAFIK